MQVVLISNQVIVNLIESGAEGVAVSVTEGSIIHPVQCSVFFASYSPTQL